MINLYYRTMKPNFNLNDKVAVITGGGGALGAV